MLTERSWSQNDTLEKVKTIAMENKSVVARSEGWKSDDKEIAKQRVWTNLHLSYKRFFRIDYSSVSWLQWQLHEFIHVVKLIEL